jgi:hypothetical protein
MFWKETIWVTKTRCNVNKYLMDFFISVFKNDLKIIMEDNTIYF